jgi:hypothetical protein
MYFVCGGSMKLEEIENKKKPQTGVIDLVIVIPGMGARTMHPLRKIPGIGMWWDIGMCADILSNTFNGFLDSDDDVYVKAVDYSTVRKEHGVDRMLEMVTLKKGVTYLRQMANNTAIDVLMYLNSNVQNEIHATVFAQLNKIYEEFIQKHPNRQVRVSIFGHSLGSVITYDILKSNEKSEMSLLQFTPEYAFLIGSPLGLFLALRHARKHTDNKLSHERYAYSRLLT